MLIIETMDIKDLSEIKDLIYQSFLDEEHSDHKEQEYVEGLIYSPDFIPELSLTAKKDGEIVGYILLYPIGLKGVGNLHALGLAPLSVHPSCQKQGVGSALIREAHKRAKKSYDLITLVGHPSYYPRFGYERAVKYQIVFPFDLPEEVKMVKKLKTPLELNGEHKIVYPKGYFS